jgi:hypothetical protein
MLHARECNTYKIVIGQRDRKRQNRKREDNIKTDLQEIGWVENGFVWIITGNSGGCTFHCCHIMLLFVTTLN